MKINQSSKSERQTSSIVNELANEVKNLTDQINDCQQDINTINDTSLPDKVSKSDQAVQTVPKLASNEITANKVTVAGVDSKLSAATAEIEDISISGSAQITEETVGTSTITTLSADDVTVNNSLSTPAIDVTNNITAGGKIESSTKVKAPTIESDSVSTGDVSTGTLGSTTANIEHITADDVVVNNSISVNNIEVNGVITGISSIQLDNLDVTDLTSDNSDLGHIVYSDKVMDNTHHLHPTPELSDTDRYTIQLPKFTGTYYLVWKNGQDTQWSAVVIGNGHDYDITWSCPSDETLITDFFQYNDQLFIRTWANGDLYFAYDTTEELEDPLIYFNMVGWTNPKSLEELCDERTHLVNAYPTGTAWFGHTFIPRLEESEGSKGGINFRGSCTFNELPAFADTDVGDVWNITNESYTDARFVEGAGKPINVGDDVVAVEVEVREVVPYSEDFGNNQFFGAYHDPETGKVLLCGGSSIYQLNNDNTVTLVQDLNDSSLVLVKFVKAGSKLYCLNDEYVYPFVYSEDNGETWVKEESFWYDYANPVNLLQAGNKIIIYSGSEGSYSSSDDGDTWTEIYLSLDGNNDFRFYTGDTVNRLANGTVLGIIPRGRYDQGTDTYSALVCTSNDGINFTSIPRTWDDDVEAVLNHTADKYPWLLQLSNGTLLAGCTITTYMPGTLPNIYTSKIIKSTDNGVTWSLFKEIEHYSFYTVVELEDGTLYAVGTNLVSKDYGETWEIISEDLDTFAAVNPMYPCVQGMNVIVPHSYDRTGGTRLYLESHPGDHEIKWDKFAAGVNYDNFATVATTGDYNDLTNKPSITPVDSVTDGNMNPVTSNAVYDNMVTKVSKTGQTDLSGTFMPSSDKGATLGGASNRFYYSYLYRILGCSTISNSTSGNQLTLPSKSGTLATLDDISGIRFPDYSQLQTGSAASGTSMQISSDSFIVILSNARSTSSLTPVPNVAINNNIVATCRNTRVTETVDFTNKRVTYGYFYQLALSCFVKAGDIISFNGVNFTYNLFPLS